MPDSPPSAAASRRHPVIRALAVLRASWLILGVSLLLLLLLEGTVRAAHYAIGVRRARRVAALPPALRDPQSSEPWFEQLEREYEASRPQRWKSYVYFGRRPGFRSRYVNVDAEGHRVTPQRRTGSIAASVYFFGGSTMWGTAQRDSFTIAAETARRLQSLVAPRERIEVTNFGESGYVSTQELLALMLALRAGRRPDVVVFYDGINDVGTAVQNGVAGIPQNESKRVAEFALGRAIDRQGFEHGLAKDARALAALGREALKQLAIVDVARGIVGQPALPLVSADSAARGVVRVYVENVRLIEAMARTYDFVPLYVWQPSIHSTRKPLTPFEASLRSSIAADSFQATMRRVHLAVPALLAPAMDSLARGRFVDADSLFSRDTVTVFADRIGHNIERTVPRIVDAFWPVLQREVAGRLRHGSSGAPAARAADSAALRVALPRRTSR